MRKILSFKHWHLFILIGITGVWKSPSPLQEIINSISIATLLIWIYAIGNYGQEEVRRLDLPTLNSKLFNFNILMIPILFLVIYLLPETPEVSNEFVLSDIILIPTSLYIFYAIFQTIIFACKTISTIELKRQVKLEDYIGNLFLIFIFIIGIWILQPKINKLIGQDFQN